MEGWGISSGISVSSAPIVSHVYTAATPGCVCAALVSMERMRACANGIRRNAACSGLTSGMSSTKAPSPRNNFGSMLR